MQTSGRWRLIPALATAPATRPMTYLALRHNAAQGVHELVLVAEDDVLLRTEHLDDARKVAQVISAWTLLAVVEVDQ